jgi:hypothetical protein
MRWIPVLVLLFLMVAGQAPAVGAPAAAATKDTAADPLPEDFDSLLRAAWWALRAGDDQRAMLAYEKVLARADDSRMQLRALICIAMARLMPSSAVHDAEAAELAMQELDRRVKLYGLEQEFFGELELLRLVAAQERELSALRTSSRKLKRDLAQRDELIRQLRALSVEQQ